MRLRIRHRFRIAVAVLLCLLFQQAAMVAYACPLQEMPPDLAVMAEHCAEMGMQRAQDNPVLCEKHCDPDTLVSADQAKLSVPALPSSAQPLTPALLTPAVHVEPYRVAAVARSQPPPRLRFCSLLI